MNLLNLDIVALERQQHLLREAEQDRLASLLPPREPWINVPKNPRPDWLRGLAILFRPGLASQAS